MQFDDRLATVLRMQTSSATGERTQLRQLLDLLGTAPPGPGGESGYARLVELRRTIPIDEQAEILREAGLRLRNPQLVGFLASGAPKAAAAALATARLTDGEWQDLIPRLSITARGLLRHRRDLPKGAIRLLEQLGVGDLVLSDGRKIAAGAPAFADTDLPSRPEHAPAQPPSSPPMAAVSGTEPIGELIERIEQFRSARRIPVLAPRLPLGDTAPAEASRIEAFDVVTDAAGRASWASPMVAPWIVGMALTSPRPGTLASLDINALAALRRHQPLVSCALALTGAPAITGDWRIDATPVFAEDSGAFCGYRCRLLRAIPVPAAAPAQDSHAERMRQVLHELRTPVNAIQGFAEIIQQQLFGAVPHEYRAHAAEIAMDAARLLAGLEDIERLARLESGAISLDRGAADLRLAVHDTLARLEATLAARGAGFALAVEGENFNIGIDPIEAQTLCWRIMASAAGAMVADERLAIRLSSSNEEIQLVLQLPAAMGKGDANPRAVRASVGSGMLGPHFAFRLAAAEAHAAGGSVSIDEQNLALTMPVLTAPRNSHSRTAGQSGS